MLSYPFESLVLIQTMVLDIIRWVYCLHMKEKYQQIILVRVVLKRLHDEPHSSESLLYSVSSPSVFSTWCHPSEHQIADKKTLKSPWQLCGACLPLAPLSETLRLTPLILHLLQRFPQPFGSWLKARSLPLSPAFSRKPLTRILLTVAATLPLIGVSYCRSVPDFKDVRM